MILRKYHRIAVTSSIIILFVSVCGSAQIPDDINGRLWRLCKAWGFAKYFHENQCSVDWNVTLIKAIDSTLVSTSNASFNIILRDMLATAGPISHVTEPLIIEADTNLNARFDWTNDPFLNPYVSDQLDSILMNFRPRENCFVKLTNGYIDFSSDPIEISNVSYDNEANRLLVFFNYWNIVNYFNPNRYLMDNDWDTTLYHFIPIFRETKNDEKFHIQFLNLVTQINDSHGFTSSPVITAHTGVHFPLLKVNFIEEQTVVTKVHTSITGISEGDILLGVNGIDISILRDSLSHLTAASNDHALNRNIDQILLRGLFSSPVLLELKDSTGIIYTKSLSRLYLNSAYYQFIHDNNSPAWEITNCGYGYVNMGNLYTSQLPSMYEDLKDTPAIIFDVRNYPNDVINDLISFLFPGPITYALFTSPDPTYPGWYAWKDNRGQTGSFSNPDPYNGKVIILVNAVTQSHAEYTVMGLQQHPNAYTIGSQTAGADGNVTSVVLPGSINTVWTGLGVYYPDSTSAQRVGVRIDSIVNPTIEDIRRGRDPELMAAFDCPTSLINEPLVFNQLHIYPNPVKETLHFELDTDDMGEMSLSLYNITGQEVFRSKLIKSSKMQIFQENVANYPSGGYLLVVSINDSTYSEKIIIQK